MENDKNKIRQQIEFAKDCVEGIPNLGLSYKDIAFRVILESLISNSRNTVQGRAVPNILQAPIKIETLAALLKKIKSKSHSDKVLAIAFYLYKVKGISKISRNDIETEYKNALLAPSSNLTVDINNNIKRDYMFISNDGKKRLFCITSEGIAHIESRVGIDE